jgi:hypothetical protein
MAASKRTRFFPIRIEPAPSFSKYTSSQAGLAGKEVIEAGAALDGPCPFEVVPVEDAVANGAVQYFCRGPSEYERDEDAAEDTSPLRPPHQAAAESRR